MEDAELVKKLMAGIDNKKQTASKKSADNLLDEISKTRTVSLKETINEILEQIKFREDLHKEMMDDIEQLKSTINNMVPAMSADNAKAIVEFQKKLIEAEEMKTQEKLNCFRDIAQLKKELREFIREVSEKESRASLLGDLLSE